MPSAWSSGTMPRPPRKAATGASSSSASARTASLACCAPLPVMIIGRLAAASSLAAASTSSGEGAGRLRDCCRAQRLDVGTRRHRVPRHLDRDRAGPPRQHLAERLVDDLRRVGRTLDARRPFRQRAQGGELVGQLVQMAAAAAEEGRGNLPRDAQHRRAAPVRRAQRRRGVEDAGPRHDREHARPARRARIAERHVAAGLLVTGADGADLLAALLQRVEQRIELRARQAEHRVDAVGDQRLDDRHAAGHRPGLGLVPHRVRASCRLCGAGHIRPWRADLE